MRMKLLFALLKLFFKCQYGTKFQFILDLMKFYSKNLLENHLIGLNCRKNYFVGFFQLCFYYSLYNQIFKSQRNYNNNIITNILCKF